MRTERRTWHLSAEFRATIEESEAVVECIEELCTHGIDDPV